MNLKIFYKETFNKKIFVENMKIAGIALLVGMNIGAFANSGSSQIQELETQYNNFKLKRDEFVKISEERSNEILKLKVDNEQLQTKIDSASPWFENQELGGRVDIVDTNSSSSLKDKGVDGFKLGLSPEDIQNSTDELVLNLYSDKLDYGRLILVSYDKEIGFKFKGNFLIHENKNYAMWFLYYDEDEIPIKEEIMEEYKYFDITKENESIKIEDYETEAYVNIGYESRINMIFKDKPSDTPNIAYSEQFEELLKSELAKAREGIDGDKLDQFDKFTKSAIEKSDFSPTSW